MHNDNKKNNNNKDTNENGNMLHIRCILYVHLYT